MISLDKFIEDYEPHNIGNGYPPKNKFKRREWESKILYSVIDSLSENNTLLDIGCGRYATLRFTLFKRFSEMKYIGLDPFLNERGIDKLKIENNIDFSPQKCFIGKLDMLDSSIDKADCVVAGSVFTHFDWEGIKGFLDNLKPLFDRGGEFGFTIFMDDDYTEDFTNKQRSSWYKNSPIPTYHVVTTTIKQYQDYCKDNGLEFSLLPYHYDLDHTLKRKSDGREMKQQHFCNIRRKS